jgi:hypothetical protein
MKKPTKGNEKKKKLPPALPKNLKEPRLKNPRSSKTSKYGFGV